MSNSALRQEARDLRAKGLTYDEIKKTIGLSIPKSTLSTWCSGIKLSQNQAKRIANISKQRLVRAQQLAVSANKQKREEYFSAIERKYTGIEKAIVSDRKNILIALALLYLAEGSKGSVSRLTFGNSDPKIIALYLALLRRAYEIDELKFRCTLQCRADQNITQLQSFWSECTGIPLIKFYKARIDPRSIGKRTEKTDYKGVCRIDYFSANIYNELQVIAKIITNGPLAQR